MRPSRRSPSRRAATEPSTTVTGPSPRPASRRPPAAHLALHRPSNLRPPCRMKSSGFCGFCAGHALARSLSRQMSTSASRSIAFWARRDSAACGSAACSAARSRFEVKMGGVYGSLTGATQRYVRPTSPSPLTVHRYPSPSTLTPSPSPSSRSQVRPSILKFHLALHFQFSALPSHPWCSRWVKADQPTPAPHQYFTSTLHQHAASTPPAAPEPEPTTISGTSRPAPRFEPWR